MLNTFIQSFNPNTQQEFEFSNYLENQAYGFSNSKLPQVAIDIIYSIDLINISGLTNTINAQQIQTIGMVLANLLLNNLTIAIIISQRDKLGNSKNDEMIRYHIKGSNYIYHILQSQPNIIRDVYNKSIDSFNKESKKSKNSVFSTGLGVAIDINTSTNLGFQSIGLTFYYILNDSIKYNNKIVTYIKYKIEYTKKGENIIPIWQSKKPEIIQDKLKDIINKFELFLSPSDLVNIGVL